MAMSGKDKQGKNVEFVYTSPKKVSMISDITGIVSWVVLVGFIGHFVSQVFYLLSQMKTNNLVIATLIKEPSFISYLFTNFIIPLMTGIGLFVLLQAVASGLNMLLEMDLNAKESGKEKE